MVTTESEDFLEHYGVKGMRWGIRRNRDSSSKPNKNFSEDALRAHDSRKKAKKSGVSSLSNQELQFLNTRMDLEMKYSRMTQRPGILRKGAVSVAKLIGAAGTMIKVYNYANSDAAKALRKKLEATKI